MSSPPTLAMALPIVVALLFVGVWLVVCRVLARRGGWSGLASTHRARRVPVGERFRFVSGSMGGERLPVNYKRCLSVVVSRRGFGLSTVLPFRFGSPPLFIPWTDVTAVTEKSFFRTFGVAVRLRKPGPVISVRGRAAHRMRKAYAASMSGRSDSAFDTSSLTTL